MPAPVANYCVEQGRGVFRRGALCYNPPLYLNFVFHSYLNSRADKTCFGKLRQLQKKGDKMPAKKVDEEFLQSCSFKVAEILQIKIDEMCKAAVQKFKQGYEDEIARLKAEISQLTNSQEFICAQCVIVTRVFVCILVYFSICVFIIILFLLVV